MTLTPGCQLCILHCVAVDPIPQENSDDFSSQRDFALRHIEARGPCCSKTNRAKACRESVNIRWWDERATDLKMTSNIIVPFNTVKNEANAREASRYPVCNSKKQVIWE